MRSALSISFCASANQRANYVVRGAESGYGCVGVWEPCRRAVNARRRLHRQGQARQLRRQGQGQQNWAAGKRHRPPGPFALTSPVPPRYLPACKHIRHASWGWGHALPLLLSWVRRGPNGPRLNNNGLIMQHRGRRGPQYVHLIGSLNVFFILNRPLQFLLDDLHVVSVQGHYVSYCVW